MRKFWIFLLLIVTFISAYAANDLRRILRALEKSDLEKALEIIEKSLSDIDINPGTEWIYSDLLSNDTLEIYDLDQARDLINEAINNYPRAEEKLIEEITKLGFDRSHLDSTFLKIRKISFRDVLDTNAITSYRWYLNTYPDAPEKSLALAKIDSIAFLNAKSVNTWQAYQDYYINYPNSIYRNQANDKYEILLFKEHTASGELADYENFVKKYPASPYIPDAHKYIFKYGTLDHEPGSFLEYINDYPEALEVQKAIGILYHLDKETFLSYSELLGISQYDSLLYRFNQDRLTMIPVFEGTKIGFIDMKGEWIIRPVFDSLYVKDPFCQLFHSDHISGKSEGNDVILTRSSDILFDNTSFYSVSDLGLGVLFIRSKESNKLIHKTGFTIIDSIEEAELFADRWFKIKRNDKWGLISFTGVMLTSFEFTDIYQIDNFYVFERGNEIALSNLPTLLDEVGENGFPLEFKFDDLEVITNSLIIGFKEGRECVVNDQLSFEIPWKEHTVYPHPTVLYAKENDNYRIYDNALNSLFPRQPIQEIAINDNWIGVKQDQWTLVNLTNNEATHNIDSLKLINNFSVLFFKSDSSSILFKNGQRINVVESQEVENLRYRSDDGLISDYLVVGENSRALWDDEGNYMFQLEFDEISNIDTSFFKITKDGKQGVLDKKGNVVLDSRYDFLNYREGMIITLLDGKIGAVDIKNNVIIPEEYGATISRFGDLYISQKEGRYGLLDQENQVLVEFKLEEIIYATDSLAWIKTDSTWQLLNFFEDQLEITDVLDLTLLFDISGERYFRILTEKGYGIVTSQKGQIVNDNFSDIRVIRSKEEMYFLAEHYVPEAGYYVLVAYDIEGRKLYSNACNEEEYDRIYCE